MSESGQSLKRRRSDYVSKAATPGDDDSDASDDIPAAQTRGGGEGSSFNMKHLLTSINEEQKERILMDFLMKSGDPIDGGPSELSQRDVDRSQRVRFIGDPIDDDDGENIFLPANLAANPRVAASLIDAAADRRRDAAVAAAAGGGGGADDSDSDDLHGDNKQEVESADELFAMCTRGDGGAMTRTIFPDIILRETLDLFEEKWIDDSVQPIDVGKWVAERLFGEPPTNELILNIALVHRLSNLHLSHIVYLYMIFDVTNTFMIAKDATRLERRFQRIFEVIVTGRYYCIDHAQLHNAMQVNALFKLPADISMFRFSFYNNASHNENQRLLVHVLRHIRDKNLRRVGDQVYEETMYNYNGKIVATRAWHATMDCFEKLVRDATPRETLHEQWSNLTKQAGSMKFVVNYLQQAREDEFPTLKPDRRVFAFRNGVFVCGVDEEIREAYLTAHPEEEEYAICAIENNFYAWEAVDFPANVVACNFIDMMFDLSVFDYEDAIDIPTPNFDRILHTQNFHDPSYETEGGVTQPVIRWLYALGIGRLLYDVQEREGWECLLFLKGLAGTGKSVFSQIISSLYPKNKIGAVSNRFEKQFGLSSIFGMWVWIAKEVKANFGIDQGDLQSMITGEEVMVSIKFKVAQTEKWKVPGLVLGNETANWVDAAGSMGRRLIVADFANSVKAKDNDPGLWRKIKTELPLILFKANAMYLDFTKAYRHTQIWEAMPKYFTDQRVLMAATLNPLEAFLSGESSEVIISMDEVVPLEEFAVAYSAFCRTQNLGRNIRFTVDHYRDVFQKHGFFVRSLESETWRGREYSWVKFIVGVGLRNNDI